MHPIERLRYVARAGTGAGPSLLVREAAAALASVGSEPAGLVTGCRRLIARHPAVGPLWWLSARVLHAADPIAEAWQAAADVDQDPTDGVLAAHLPDEVTVTVVGWPELTAEALKRRGDIEPLVVESAGDGRDLVRRLRSLDVEAVAVPESGAAAAVVESDLVVLEATALGPTGFVAASGSHAVAAVAYAHERPVWVAAGAGRVLPARLWDAVVDRLSRDDDPWDLDHEVVPGALVSCVAGPDGPGDWEAAVHRADCPVAPELLKEVK